MVVNINNPIKLNIKRIIISKINVLIFNYMNKFDVESIHMTFKIDNIEYRKTIPHYGSKMPVEWNHTNGIVLLKVLECLRNKDFYGMCKLHNGQMVKITPRKDV